MGKFIVIHVPHDCTLFPVYHFICYTPIIRVDLKSHSFKSFCIELIPQHSRFDASVKCSEYSDIENLDSFLVNYILGILGIDLDHNVHKYSFYPHNNNFVICQCCLQICTWNIKYCDISFLNNISDKWWHKSFSRWCGRIHWFVRW